MLRRSLLVIPLQQISTSKRRPHPPIATVSGANVEATLDSAGTEYGMYRIRLILRALNDPAITRQVHSVYGTDEAGHELQSDRGENHFLWKSDGSPLADGEEGKEFDVGAPGEDPGSLEDAPPSASRTLSLKVDVRAIHLIEHYLDCTDIPVPAPGGVLTPNLRMHDALGASVVVQKVVAYSPDHPLPERFDYPNKAILATAAPAGLAVILAEPPDPKGEKPFDLGVVTAVDPAGYRRLPTRSLPFANGDALSGAASQAPGAPARTMTVFLDMPAVSARTFNLRLYREDKTRLKQRETLSFPDFPAPTLTNRP